LSTTSNDQPASCSHRILIRLEKKIKTPALKKLQLLFTLSVFIFSCSSLCAQQADSILKVNSRQFNWKSVRAPLVLITAGVLVNGNGQKSIKNKIVEERNEHMPNFSTSIDDYLRYAPIVIAYGLDALGYQSKTDIKNRTAILIKGQLLMLGTTAVIKNMTHQLRPDMTENNSFPSGHTAQAFAAATFLSEEYKNQFEWMPYLAYSIASAVGMLRIANNRHYISDVLVGAGLGILSMKVSYLTHQYKWGKKQHAVPSF